MRFREITIECFGCLKSIDEFIQLSVPESCSVLDAKILLGKKVGDSYLKIIHQSVLADHHKIYSNQDVLPKGQHFSILPPVCGG